MIVVGFQPNRQAGSHRGEQALDHADRRAECAVFDLFCALGADPSCGGDLAERSFCLGSLSAQQDRTPASSIAAGGPSNVAYSVGC